MEELPKKINLIGMEWVLVTHHFDYSDVDIHMYVGATTGTPFEHVWRRTDNMLKWLELTKRRFETT